MSGIKHLSKFQVGQRLNGFTLLRNYRIDKDKYNEWLWDCQCDCGKIFHSRERKLLNRVGCISCTASKKQTEISVGESGREQQGIKLRLYKDYKAGAKKRNLEFDLSFDQFLDIVSLPCVYCGQKPTVHESELHYMQKFADKWEHNGIDRVDSSKGYTLDNCVSCCSKCNYAKHDLSLDDFKDWIKNVYKHLNLECSTTIPKGSTDKRLEMENSIETISIDEDIVSTERC